MFYSEFFCANEGCPLHVRPGDPGVSGAGEWAQLRNGLLVSRSADANGRMVCDLCLRQNAIRQPRVA